MSTWTEHKLKDLVEIVNGFAFKSPNFINNKIAGALPVVKIKNVANGDVHLNGCQYHIFDNSLKRYVIEKGDILIALTGNHPEVMTQVVGEASRYKLDEQSLLNQRVAKVIAKQGLNPDFLYYFLKDDSTHDYLASQSAGSANQANISKTDIEEIVIQLPGINEQGAIAEILKSLDDKIDLLQSQNITLEQLAETIFRQRFIEEMNANWPEKSLLDAIELVGGGTPKTEKPEYWNGEIKWLSGGDISSNHKGFVTDSEKSITQLGVDNSSAKLLPRFCTVISARGTVGKYCMLSEPMAFSQSNYGIAPKYENCYFFTYLLVAHSVDELLSAAYGSVFDTITTSTFKDQRIHVPSRDEILVFEKSVSPYFLKILGNQIQCKSLRQLRNTLTSKLFNGEGIILKSR